MRFRLGVSVSVNGVRRGGILVNGLIGAAGGARAVAGPVMRGLALHVIVAWGALHLLAHQAGHLSHRPMLDSPVEASLSEAGIPLLETEIVLVWDEPPGSPLFTIAEDTFYWEGRVHGWMASLGRSLGISRWQVLERRDGPPFLLGLGGTTRDGSRLEVWLSGADEIPAGLPGTARRGGLIVRMSRSGEDGQARLLDEWFPLLPADWFTGPLPHVLTRWKLAMDSAAGDPAQSLREALSARIVERRSDGRYEQVWLASPRGTALPRAVAGLAVPRGATAVATWATAENAAVELVASPTPLSALARTIDRMWRRG